MKPRALMLLGPTASGKTALALALSEVLPLEIISVDSALIYRGMDIGSAKPTKEEQLRCPHHLIDCREISEPYSAADFRSDALRLMDEIRARHRVPLIVGGTMLYVKALREGIDELPSTDERVRDDVLREGRARGWPAMHEALREIDPLTAQKLQPNDSQRIARALEVFRLTGRPLSSLQNGTKAIDESIVTFGLIPGKRESLHAAIAARFDAMLEAGFIEEVKSLMARDDFDRDLPAMRSVGYRQAIEYLREEVDFDTFRDKACAATRQLAKRQMTWLRSMASITLFDPQEKTPAELIKVLQQTGKVILAA